MIINDQGFVEKYFDKYGMTIDDLKPKKFDDCIPNETTINLMQYL